MRLIEKIRGSFSAQLSLWVAGFVIVISAVVIILLARFSGQVIRDELIDITQQTLQNTAQRMRHAIRQSEIIAQLEQMACFREARTIMLYYPIHNEVDLRSLLTKYAGQKTFLLPVTHRHSMEVRPYDGEDMMRKGRLGVPEPQTSTYRGSIDLIIVPGVVFDQHRHRIGRGGGYYDKFLSKQHHAKKVGVCYAFQLKKHDIPHMWNEPKMDRVVTPQLTIG